MSSPRRREQLKSNKSSSSSGGSSSSKSSTVDIGYYDDGSDEGWLYRRMLSDSQQARRLRKRMSGESSLLQQALNELEWPLSNSSTKNVKVWKITSSRSSFAERYFAVDKTRQYICVTHQPVLSEDDWASLLCGGDEEDDDIDPRGTNKLSILLWKLKSKKLQQQKPLVLNVADISAWHIGLVATKRAERARQLESSETFDKLAAKKLLTIYYNGGHTLDLIVPQQLNELVFSLNEMYATYHRILPWISRDVMFLKYMWSDAVRTQWEDNSRISSLQFEAICKRIHFRTSRARQAFEKHTTSEPSLTRQECTELFRSLKPNLPSISLFIFLFGNEPREISVQEWHEKFLLDVQGELNTTARHAQALLAFIKIIELDQQQTPQQQDLYMLQQHRFHEFLHSELNDAYDPEAQYSHQRMDRPISEYWINSSHHTYLTGGKLRSKPSCEGYMKALMRGCKCLELDCWDGPSRHGKPIPVVGHTSCNTKLEFRQVCEVVKGYMKLYPQSCPIILSIENHCSDSYQQAIVKILKNVLGKQIASPSSKQEQSEVLPSPESLRGQVVLQQRLPLCPATGVQEAEIKKDQSACYDQLLKLPRTIRKNHTSTPELIPALEEMTLLYASKNEPILPDIDTVDSMGESSLTLMEANKKQGVRDRNALYMTRIYPQSDINDSKSNRSCNFNPIQAWSLGCQLVSLNFPLDDTAMILNDGLFRQGCGYVLKPDSVLGRKEPVPSTVYFRILSGSCLPQPKGWKEGTTTASTTNIFVSVTLHDLRIEDGEALYTDRHTTDVIEDNGYSPVWRDKGKKFSVQQPDVAMLLVQVWNRNPAGNDRIASAAIPVSCLRRGYRSIQLFDEKNHRSGAFRYASLLVHIEY
eukprot:scaffold9264_cov123-Cylindrotheca_fusiformis.AAC.5